MLHSNSLKTFVSEMILDNDDMSRLLSDYDSNKIFYQMRKNTSKFSIFSCSNILSGTACFSYWLWIYLGTYSPLNLVKGKFKPNKFFLLVIIVIDDDGNASDSRCARSKSMFVIFESLSIQFTLPKYKFIFKWTQKNLKYHVKKYFKYKLMSTYDFLCTHDKKWKQI